MHRPCHRDPDSSAVIHDAQELLHQIEWLLIWPSADRRTRVVFITMDTGRDLVQEIIALADRMATRTARRVSAQATQGPASIRRY